MMFSKASWSLIVVFVAVLLTVQHPGIAGAGGPIGDFSVNISNQTNDEMRPAVAYNSEAEEYLVVWYDSALKNIYGQRVSRNGMLLGSRFDIGVGMTDGDRLDPDVVYNPDRKEYLVVYALDDGFGVSVRGYRISAEGVKQGNEIKIQERLSSSAHLVPVVSYAGTNQKYLVVWQFDNGGGNSIVGRVVSAAGLPEGGGGANDPYYLFYISQFDGNHREHPDVAYNRRSNRYLVVWQQGHAGDHDIYARQVHGDGTPVANPTSIEIIKFIDEQISPAVGAIRTAGTKGQYLVAYEDRYPWSDRGIIRVTRVDGDGTVLSDGQDRAISDKSMDADSFNPAVAGNENSQKYLVAWTQHYPIGSSFVYTGIAGREIASNGDPVSRETRIAGWDGQNSAVVGGWGGDFLVAWDDLPFSATRDVYGALWGNRVYLPLALR
jgi:hypothetical protein